MSLEFPLQFNRTKQGHWHWVVGTNRVCANSAWAAIEATTCLDEQAVYALLENSPEECWEEMTGGRRYTRGLSRWIDEPGKRSSCVCCVCLYELVEALRQKPQRGNQLKIDHTKPIIVCSDESIHQAESKTLADAKRKAKSLLDDNNILTATIYAPHTKVARSMPPIKTTRIKWS